MSGPLPAGDLGRVHLGRYLVAPMAGRAPVAGWLASVAVWPGGPVTVRLRQPTPTDHWSESVHILSASDTVEITS